VPVWPRVGKRQYALRFRSVAFAAVLGVSLLVWPMAAFGALWVRIGVEPERPAVGQVARVTVQTLLVEGASCLDDPSARVTPTVAYTGADTGGPFLDHMELRSVGAAIDPPVTVQVTRRADDPTIWEGTVVFPTAGRWLLRMFTPSWPGAPGRAQVQRRW